MHTLWLGKGLLDLRIARHERNIDKLNISQVTKICSFEGIMNKIKRIAIRMGKIFTKAHNG